MAMMSIITTTLMNILCNNIAYEKNSYEVLHYEHTGGERIFHTMIIEPTGTFGLRKISVDSKNQLTDLSILSGMGSKEEIKSHIIK